MWFLSSKSDVLNHDVTVNGRRQGITKTDIHKPQARSSICSISLFRCFHNLLDKIKPTSVPTSLGIESMKTLTYWETKSLATKYQAAWADLRDSVFRTWISKQRELLNFCVND
uniref:tRNA-specific adenosine deaminase 1 n=1 Tax=Arion vulgaris TaxID=1028688 RepID=A0A0B6ZTG4_9EUPU